jgi:peptidoglycan/LPS O-acetylase OafA/YrhL
MSQARSIDDALRETRGMTTGFDYLRIGLALYVFLWHCLAIPDPETGRFIYAGWFGPAQRSILPMFFALSGFLVAGSFTRNSLAKFVALRALRIVPALAVEVAMSAVVIGVAFTTLPLHDYFASPQFWAYFLNIVGDVHLQLPGVFEGMFVNSQLWTLPYELQCYLALVVISLLGLARSRALLLAVTLSVCLLMTYLAVKGDLMNNGPAAPRLTLPLSFLCGVCLYMFREKAPLRHDLMLACVVVSYGVLYVRNLAFLAPLPLAYVTVFLGLLNPPKLRTGDISYGVYLFHCPILVCLYNLAGRHASWQQLLLLGLPLTLGFATLSWTFIESPIANRKRAVLAGLDLIARKFARLRLRRAAPVSVS